MKRLLLFFLVISVGFNLYLLDKDVVTLTKGDSRTALKDAVTVGQSSLSQTRIASPKKYPKLISKKRKKKSTTSKDNDYFKDDEAHAQNEIAEARAAWIIESDRFLMEELNLSHSQVEIYKELAVEREKEVNNYFLPKMLQASKDAKDSDSKTTFYMHNTQDKAFVAEIAQRYDELLKDNFSQDDFFRYREFVRNYNQKRIQDGSFYPIEF
jgi:hypothetical protein